MSENRTPSFGEMVLASAAIAAVITFGSVVIPSAISQTSTDIEVVSCAGQTWPHYGDRCIPAADHDGTETGAVRKIEIPGAEG